MFCKLFIVLIETGVFMCIDQSRYENKYYETEKHFKNSNNEGTFIYFILYYIKSDLPEINFLLHTLI